MKVLFISNYFPPISGPGSYRPYYFVKYLSEKVDSITVVCAEEDNVYGKDDSFSTDFSNVNIIRIGENAYTKFARFLFKVRLFPLFNILFPKRFFERHTSWVNSSLNYLKSNVTKGDFDVAYVTSGPFCSVFIAEYLKDKLGLPFVLDLRDPFSMSPARIWMSYFHWQYFQGIEERILKKASEVVVVAPSMKTHYLNLFKGLNEDKLSVIYNGFEKQAEKTEQLNNEKCKIVYAGSLSDYDGNFTPKSYGVFSLPYMRINYNVKTRSLYYLLHGLALMNADLKQKIEVEVYTGSDLPFTKSLIQKLDLQNVVKVHNKVAYATLTEKVKDANWLYLPMEERLDGKSYFMTGKLYEYMAFNKPILTVGTQNDITDLLDQINFPFKNVNHNAEAIKELLTDLINKDYNGNQVQPKPEKLAMLTRKFQANQLYNLLEKSI